MQLSNLKVCIPAPLNGWGFWVLYRAFWKNMVIVVSDIWTLQLILALKNRFQDGRNIKGFTVILLTD